MMTDLFQSTAYYFFGLFRATCLYIMVTISSSLYLFPVQAKLKSKSTIDQKIDHSQENTAARASSKRKSKPTLEHYKKKSAKQDPFVKEQMAELLRSTTQLGLSAGLIFGLHQCTNKPFELSTLVGPLISSLATDPLKAIGRSCAMLFFPSLSKPKLKQAIDLKKQYRKERHFFSKHAKFYRTDIKLAYL